jgi:formylglycine-generating enzyme required for sulfatase activity
MKKLAPAPAPPLSRRLAWLLGIGALGLAVAAVVLGQGAFAPTGEAPPAINKAEPLGPAPEGMVWVPGGQFWMGDNYPDFPDARPVHLVYVDGFWMDRTTVTNEQFAKFVEATGYQTVAERKPKPEDFPPHLRADLKPELMVPGAMVFRPPPGVKSHKQCASCYAWWAYVLGACWKHPQGPGSSIEGKGQHPVVQVCWEDAVQYALWADKRLPTEAEWEFAARGGLDRKIYCWGDELLPGGKWQANVWQGTFPGDNTAADGFPRTAPVASFAANGYSLYDMAGNVWQWCSDWYQPDYYTLSPSCNPQGPGSSTDPDGAGVPKRVQRGGSFLCSEDYCVRYRVGGRGQGDIHTGMEHTGFRCVRKP